MESANTGYIYASAPTGRGAGIGSYLALNRERGPWPRSGSGQLVFPSQFPGWVGS